MREKCLGIEECGICIRSAARKFFRKKLACDTRKCQRNFKCAKQEVAVTHKRKTQEFNTKCGKIAGCKKKADNKEFVCGTRGSEYAKGRAKEVAIFDKKEHDQWLEEQKRIN